MMDYKRKRSRHRMLRRTLATCLVALLLTQGLWSEGLPQTAWVPTGVMPVQAQTATETVRVGIYFGKDNVSTVSLRSDTGLALGVNPVSGIAVPLWTQPDGSTVIVRKDAWYVRSAAGVVQEYQPTAGVPFAGEIIGPIHLRIGDVYPDYAAAAAMAAQYLQAGIRAYPAYEGGWQVWTGTYPDMDAANAAKQTTADTLATSAITVLPPTATRLVVYNANLDILCLYGGTDGPLSAVSAQGSDLLHVNGRRYRGSMEFRRYADSDLTLINVLGIEAYLYGVVPSEIEALAPTEAIKAQAVAARTYALKNIGRYQKWGFDLTDTIESQVYNGYEREKVQTNLAVDATVGQRAMYNGTLASLFYFSSSGGRTEDNANVWGASLPYLKSVEDPYESRTSYNYYWQKVLTTADVQRYLAAAGVNLGIIQSVVIDEISLSGRVLKLRVKGSGGSMTFAREACRTLFELPSQLYSLGGAQGISVLGSDGTVVSKNPGGLTAVSATGTGTVSVGIAAVAVGADGVLSYTGTAASDLFVFTGRGWGHGVGMSQEGAKGYARNGYTYTQILQHYFPGVTIE